MNDALDQQSILIPSYIFRGESIGLKLAELLAFEFAPLQYRAVSYKGTITCTNAANDELGR